MKPSVGGSTIGIRRVECTSEFNAAVDDALALHPEVLIEEFVAGAKSRSRYLKARPVVRIIPESGFFDFEAKYTDGKTVYEVPADIPDCTVTWRRRLHRWHI